MNLINENNKEVNDIILEVTSKKTKRTSNDVESGKEILPKKPKIVNEPPSNSHQEPKKEIVNNAITLENQPSQSPKKRLEIPCSNKQNQENVKKEKFIYGNYSQYYGYRNKDFHDVRLDMFAAQKEIFLDKDVLDIGCNNGFITTAVAKEFNVKTITGIDIDRSLINQGIKNLIKSKKKLPIENEARRKKLYPYNVQFLHGNYVLKDDCLLEIERAQFDVILCLSITKWIQLNFGDAGLKQAFRRMFLQLRSGGCLILEAQPFKNYRKRKYVSEAARLNFEQIKFLPEQFTDYLLSDEIGFKQMEMLGVPEHCVDGFKRPIQIFYKE